VRGKYSSGPSVRLSQDNSSAPTTSTERSNLTNRELKAPAYARSGIRKYWILDINGRRLYVFPEPGAEGYVNPVVLAKSDLSAAPLTFPDCQQSVEDLLSRSAEQSCE
jgi:Uma2 family endonuclease